METICSCFSVIGKRITKVGERFDDVGESMFRMILTALIMILVCIISLIHLLKFLEIVCFKKGLNCG